MGIGRRSVDKSREKREIKKYYLCELKEKT